ncbi:efflux RND transporter periplasmic adaptor subunit [Herminiimonas sp. NPDC097707]|uniref:efflux RND transporter periplasmic adaptor subunit n=1 Tax=Herminiimonas sp. NPDC097707 TaxID=3364007 RepID=UPI00383B7EEF
MKKRIIIMLLAVLVLVAALALGFYLHIQKLIASSPKPSPQTVTAAPVRLLEWQPQLAAVGTLSAVRGVDVTTEIAGLVSNVNFKSGQEVEAGAVLVQMNADADIAQLQSLQAAAELSASVLARDKQQFVVQAISQAQLDGDIADLKGKRALAAQQAALVAKKTIRAPFAGKLGITTVNPGQYLNPGDKVVTLQRINPIYVTFYLPQKQVSKLSLGQKVNVATDGFPDQTFSGQITALSPKIDTTTSNLQIQATLTNAERQLLPGMFANANVDVGEKKNYLTLPQTAITYNPYGSTVFIVKEAGEKTTEGKAGDKKAPAPATPAATTGLVVQQVFVTTGETRGDQVAILQGLKEGQQVVTSGQVKLKNGTSVVIDNTIQPENNPNPSPQEK